MRTLVLVAVAAMVAVEVAIGQSPQSLPIGPKLDPITKPAPVERLGNDLFRLGQLRVDTANHEVSVAGTVNPNVMALEFVANTRGGCRAYESAVTLDTDAITFNAALVLIGLESGHAKGIPKFHFDPTALEGDVVTIFIECPGGECERMPAERIMFDQAKQEAVTGGKWIYTGSGFLPDGHYRADVDAVLIGFVHDPSTVIEYSMGAGLGNYGSIVTNPKIGLAPGTPIKLTIKAAGSSVVR